MAGESVRCGLCAKFIDQREPMVVELRESATRTLRSEVVGRMEQPRDPQNVEASFHVGCYDTATAERERENIWPE